MTSVTTCAYCHGATARHLYNCPTQLNVASGAQAALATAATAGTTATATTEQLIDERETTHGSFGLNAEYGQTLRELWRESPGWVLADPRTCEALDYIAGKLSRILSGKPNEKQHWEDIAGYARLVYSDDQR